MAARPSKLSDVNAAMRETGVCVTTRSFRVCYIDEAYRHLEQEGSGRPVWTLTGHKSDAIPSAVYQRTAVVDRAKTQRRARGAAPARNPSPPTAGKRSRVQRARPVEASRRAQPQRRRAIDVRTLSTAASPQR